MRFTYILSAVIPLLMVSGLDSCSKSSSAYGSSGGTTPPAPPVVTPTYSVIIRADSHFGSVITDSIGKTLYFFSPDANGSSACTGNCIANWPAFYVATPTFGAGLTTTDFSTITRSDGTKQTTYKGWPLYYFVGDATTGDIKGDGINRIFFVAKPDYSVMIAETQLVGNDKVLYDSTYKAATGNTIYITDDRGVTLYRFSKDTAGANTFTKSDFSNDATFPIVQISTIQSVPSTLDKTAFSSITVFGKPQLTYKGWPLYKFGLDSLVRGNTRGVSIPTPGFWPLSNEYTSAAP
jgi:predicted lipoprotein with Yx(FWY)xxD motif